MSIITQAVSDHENKPVQEWHPSDNGQHRLVLGDKQTGWAGYRSLAFLAGYVGCTAYWHQEGVHKAEDWCEANAVQC